MNDRLARLLTSLPGDASRTAIEDGGRSLDFAALARSVDAVAGALQRAGVRPGEAVGVLAPRSIPWIVAMLATLRSGAVYVPLNPHLPDGRLRQQCATARVGHVLWHDVDRGRLPPGLSHQPLADVLVGPAAAAAPAGPAWQPAYRIFTSGSSGRPKAVEIGRDNLATLVDAVHVRYRLSPQDRALQVCATGFDISIEEVLPSLACGATVVIAPPLALADPFALLDLLDTGRITIANLPTALWSALLDVLHDSGRRLPPSLNRLVIGGEACSIERLQRWLALPEARRIEAINGYGPTETTITATAWTLAPIPVDSQAVPIGTPLPGASCRILGPDMQPRDNGELFIAGELVGNGYVGEPALTAEHFLPDPSARIPGARMYRSGDRAWRDDGGSWVVGGRLDRQISLHGYRIEPEEIERCLERAPQVAAAWVCAVTIGNVHTLAAYLVARDLAADDAVLPIDDPRLAAIASTLNALPDYMRPRRVRLLPRLPTGANGKTDAAALPPFDALEAHHAEPVLHSEFVECLQRCLGFSPGSLDRGFFAVGGDSIQAIRLLGMLRARGWQLELDALLAGSLSDAAAQLQPSPVVAPVERYHEHPPLDSVARARLAATTPDFDAVEQVLCVLPIQLAMLREVLAATGPGRYIEQVHGELVELDLLKFREAWRHVVGRHDILRASFSLLLREQPLLLVRREIEADWSIIDGRDWCELGAQQIESLLHADRCRGFDVQVAPLLRFTVVRLDAARAYFIWTYHHALLDGWSDMVVLDEVFQTYDALRIGGENALPTAVPLTDHQRWLAERDVASARTFWHLHLAGVDRRAPWRIGNGERPRVEIPKRRELRAGASASALARRTARRFNVSLNTVWLAAYALSALRLCACGHVVVGTLVSTRSAELQCSERIVGPLFNVLPLRIDAPASTADIGDWLAALQLVQTERNQHAHFAFDSSTMVDGGAPAFDVLFVFENMPLAAHPQTASLASRTQPEHPLSLMVWPGDDVLVEAIFDPSSVPALTVELLWTGLLQSLDLFEAGALPALDSRPVDNVELVI